MSAIKTIKRFNQHYKTFNFSNADLKSEDEFLESVIELDEKGNITVESKFDSGNQLEERNSYQYGPHGKLTEHSLLYAAENVTEKRVLNRDDKGRLLEDIKFYGSDSGERTTYTYDDKDNLLERKFYDEEGEFVSHETFTYDEKGNPLEQKKLNKEGTTEEHRTFSHPDKQTIIENEFNHDGSLASKSVISFNDDGKETTTIQTTADGKLISSVNVTYDERGNVIERRHKDFYSKTTRYTYDENNRCIVNEMFDANGMLLRKNLYEYDEAGNVTAEQVYEMDTTRGGRDKHYGTRYEYEFYGS